MAEKGSFYGLRVKSKQRYKMFLDASASSSPSRSPMHYAHTDGGVSAIRCLDQSVDEPPDSPARAPSRCLRGSYQSFCCQNFRSPRSSQSRQNSQQPRTFEHRLLLFLLTERGVVSERCINNCGAFRWAVKFGLCSEISREKISIVIHRNIRCSLPLMVNVEVPVSYQLSTRSGSRLGFGNAMMSDFTPRAQQVLALARKEAERFNHNYVGTEHLLLGLIKLGQGVAVNVLQRMGLDLETVRLEVEKLVGSHPETNMIGNIPYTPRVKKVLALAGKEAKALNHSYVGTEHILLGLLREGEGVAARVLKSLEVDPARTRNEILKELDPNFTPPESEAESPQEGTKRDVKTPALRAFGRDLTELAKKGELDPVIGRKNEIERVIQILCRRTKNNPVLIGEAGVGKTAIAEGLAQEIAAGEVPS